VLGTEARAWACVCAQPKSGLPRFEFVAKTDSIDFTMTLADKRSFRALPRYNARSRSARAIFGTFHGFRNSSARSQEQGAGRAELPSEFTTVVLRGDSFVRRFRHRYFGDRHDGSNAVKNKPNNMNIN
jgi:hypothetical protein